MKKIVLALIAATTLAACGGTPAPSPKLWMVTKDTIGETITGTLFELDVVTPSLDREVAPVKDSATNAGLDMFDIAWNGKDLYGVTGNKKFYRIRTETGKAQLITTLDKGVNALAFDNDGQLWGMGNDLFKISKDTGTMSAEINTAPLTYFPSGDIVFSSDNKLFMSASGGSNDQWVSVNTTTGATTLIGDMGKKEVYGLARIGNTFYGGTTAGELLTINPSTGATTVLRTLPVSIGSLNNPLQMNLR